MIVHDVDKGFRRIITGMKELGNNSIIAGVLKESGNADNGMTLAEIALINEFGTTKAGRNHKVTIPSRPFMRQAADKNEKEWLDFSENVVGKMIDKGAGAGQAYNIIGQKVEGDIKEIFVTGDFAPNAPATIAKKGSDTPLIDTGKLRQSIRYRIEGV